jgi:hypothetical protein
MKFDTRRIVSLLFFTMICFSVVESIRKIKYREPKEDSMTSIVNRGFSYLNLEADAFKDVDKLITKKNIFAYDIDPVTKYFGDFILNDENFRSAMNRNISHFDVKEMKKSQQITVKGRYKVVTGSDIFKDARSHILRRPISSHIFSDTVGRTNLILNVNKNFPKLSKEILDAAYDAFYLAPNALTPNHTMSDLIQNKEVIQGCMNFFNEFGTHFLTETTFGYRFGFQQEYKNKTTILRDRSGNTPRPNITNITHPYSFKERREDATVVPAASVEAPKTETSTSTSTSSTSTTTTSTSSSTEEKKADAKPVETPKKEEVVATPSTSTTSTTTTSTSTQESDPLADKPGDNLPSNSTEIATNSTGPATAGNNTVPDINQFYIGKCTVDNFFMKPETCDPNDPKLVKFEVAPISYLFNRLLQNKKDFKAKGEDLDREKMGKIYRNMEFLRQEIQDALQPNNFVITHFDSFRYQTADVEKEPCLMMPIESMKNIHHKYMENRINKLLIENLLIEDAPLPVVTIQRFGQVKKDYPIINNQEEAMYWCLRKNPIITVDQIKSGNWTQNKYLVDVKFIKDHDSKSFQDAGFNCTERWEFTDDKTKDTLRYHVCSKFTDNFINPNIITDIKFFEFHPKQYKCNDKFLNTFIDGKQYRCDCEMNYKTISDRKNQGDTFMCISRKNHLMYRPIVPNSPTPAKVQTEPKK